MTITEAVTWIGEHHDELMKAARTGSERARSVIHGAEMISRDPLNRAGFGDLIFIVERYIEFGDKPNVNSPGGWPVDINGRVIRKQIK